MGMAWHGMERQGMRMEGRGMEGHAYHPAAMPCSCHAFHAHAELHDRRHGPRCLQVSMVGSRRHRENTPLLPPQRHPAHLFTLPCCPPDCPQSLCEVCSVNYSHVCNLAAGIDPPPIMVDLNPMCLEDVIADVSGGQQGRAGPSI